MTAVTNTRLHAPAPGERRDAVPVPGSEPRAPHLRVAPKVSREVLRRRRRARLAVLAVAALSAASMFVLVAFHVFAVQASFQLDKLANERAVEQRTYEARTAEVARLSSPPTISREAQAIGMIVPTTVFFIHAPQAAPPGGTADLIASSLDGSKKTKKYLAAGP